MPVPTESLFEIAVRLFVGFAIGGLIGLEREQAESGGSFAGSRTFPLFALYGGLVQAFFPALLPVAILALTIPLTVAYVGKVWIERDVGLTTLTAAFVTVLLGAMAVHSDRGLILAVVVGGAMTVLLSAKGRIHSFVDEIDEHERRASVKFILVVLVIFPILPDREIDVLFGLNPRVIWFMVVLVTGLSFVAYVLGRFVGMRRGIVLTGVIGGFVSSTATTVSMAERSAEAPSLSTVGAFSIVIASAVMFPRALVEVVIINPELFAHAVLPLGAMTVTGVVASAILYYRLTREEVVEPSVENPFRLRAALFFGAVFAVVLLVSESASSSFGASGVYVTAFISGLADVDAITLSLSSLSADGAISREVATTGIVIGAIANTLVKAALAWLLGARQLARIVTIVLVLVSVVGLGVALA